MFQLYNNNVISTISAVINAPLSWAPNQEKHEFLEYFSSTKWPMKNRSHSHLTSRLIIKCLWALSTRKLKHEKFIAELWHKFGEWESSVVIHFQEGFPSARLISSSLSMASLMIANGPFITGKRALLTHDIINYFCNATLSCVEFQRLKINPKNAFYIAKESY